MWYLIKMKPRSVQKKNRECWISPQTTGLFILEPLWFWWGPEHGCHSWCVVSTRTISHFFSRNKLFQCHNKKKEVFKMKEVLLEFWMVENLSSVLELRRRYQRQLHDCFYVIFPRKFMIQHHSLNPTPRSGRSQYNLHCALTVGF